MKKIIRLLLVIVILFIIFLYVYLTPKGYKLNYKVDKVNVEEKYNKEKGYYEFTFKYKKQVFKYLSFDKYNKSRKLVHNVQIFEYDDYTCMLPESSMINMYPLCKNDDISVDYHLVDELKKDISSKYYKDVEVKNTKYKNININYLDNKTYLIWNYNGIDIINNKENKSLELFENDVYDITLAFLLKGNLVIPDYEEDYYFKNFYIYNVDKDKMSNWKLKTPIYFDSYLLGFNDNSMFIFDRKQNKEYEIVPHKKKMRNISPKILVQDKWENISAKKLKNQILEFVYDDVVEFKLINNKLYKTVDDYEELLTNKNVKDIVFYNNTEVYYLVDDILYKYCLEYGEIKIMSNFEWNFNYENMIFVY